MKVCVLGSGDVGRRLADAFLSEGYTVMLGTRDPAQEKIVKWARTHNERLTLGLPSQTATFAEMIVLATPWSGTENMIRLAGTEHFSGKVVIDVTNPLDFSEGTPKLAIGFSTSAGETIQGMLPEARVVKCFNTIGNVHMYKPNFSGGPPTMFYCGNDDGAKAVVSGILMRFGWEGIDLGTMVMARYLEPLAMVWISYGQKVNSWNHAFKLLKK